MGKKTISLSDDVMKFAEEKSKRLFGGSVSSYLTYLVSIDKLKEEEEAKKEKRL